MRGLDARFGSEEDETRRSGLTERFEGRFLKWRTERAKNGGTEEGSKIAERFKVAARSEIIRLEGKKRI